MAPPGIKTAETIAGYEVKERIGAGGYGEVWRAEAPGGLAKAVKFVYGNLDENRASCEMRSLNRIKAVRHPFLLSLERIEIVDGQLVIITELADGSLKERFDECRRSGIPGIPRDELLGYVRDAADALDFMSERHSLQHLDIKPENLLILAGRIKVADFGLVKEVQDKSISLMGGLTPVYAAPEVFQGSPSLHSDQYSLAVVYCEMLTGALPFPGRTAVQLATQHLHARPKLSALDDADRGPIVRALSKRAEDRFPTCRAMIDALVAGNDAESRSRSASERRGAPGTQANTSTTSFTKDDTARPRHGPTAPEKTLCLEAGEPQRKSTTTGSSWGMSGLIQESLPEEPPATIRELPPIQLEGNEKWLRPTLMVGIGGAAAGVLRRVRGWLADRFGDVAAIPSLRFLLLDTDPSALLEATRGEGSTALASDETLALPIKRAHEYRERGDNRFQWISRRWLYNVPRSLRTEGLRPLGRLALADHADKLMQALRDGVGGIVSPDALAHSKATTGQDPDKSRPQALVVASISGGTGSGMVLDVAGMIREVLHEMDLPHDGVTGILMHATGRKGTPRDLAVANAYACLTELHHYCYTGQYPGDATLGLPERLDPEPVLRHAYLLHLGDNCDESALAAATDMVAEYLYLNAASPAAAYFDRCRKPPEDDDPSPSGAIRLRTFGLVRTGCCHTHLPSDAADLLAAEVVDRWRGQGADAESAVVAACERLVGSLQLDVTRLTQYARHLLEQCLGQAPDEFFQKLVRNNTGRASKSDPSRMREIVDSVFDRRSDEPGGPGLAEVLDDALADLGTHQAQQIRGLTLNLVDSSEARVRAGRRAADWFLHFVESLASEARERTGRLQTARESLEPKLQQRKSAVRDWIEYCRVRLEVVVLEAIQGAARQVRASIAGLSDLLADVDSELARLKAQFAPAQAPARKGPKAKRNQPEEPPADPATQLLRQRLPELAAQLDSHLAATTFNEYGGLWGLVNREACVAKMIADALRAESRTAVLGLIRESMAADPAADTSDEGADPVDRLGTLSGQATPRLLPCGGARQTVLVVPRPDEAVTLRAMKWEGWPAPPSTVADAAADPVLCQEVSQVPLRRAAATLLADAPECIKLAARLRSRIDVPWISMGHEAP